ncbi:MAG: hypothetical protein J6N18_12960 [Kiritimatiellae bacterium]|nr:hypothetical protein [Kiritimatiellia bacterium]
MQRVWLKIFMAVVPFVVGCASVEGWMAGSITEGIPKMRDKLPRTAKIHFADPVNARGYALHERNRKQVQEAFGKAFDALGVSHSTETNGCSHVINVVVENWEYGDAGFLGKGDRDEISMAVMLQNADTDRVLTRASLYARNLDVLVMKYVKTLFEDEK